MGAIPCEGHLLHPRALACCKHPANVEVDMNPLLASLEVAGLPITILLIGTPLAAIWKTAVCGHVLEDVLRRFAHVVYSDAPSALVNLWYQYEAKNESS